jgi:hypothetical protein
MNRAERRTAERELARTLEFRPPPDGDAGDDENRVRMQAVSGRHSGLTKGIEARRETLNSEVPEQVAALHLACRDRVHVMCDHIQLPAGEQPSVIFLASGVAKCMECYGDPVYGPLPVLPGRVQVLDEDGCDICGEPPDDNIFRPFAVNIGPVVVLGDVGSCCAEALGFPG